VRAGKEGRVLSVVAPRTEALGACPLCDSTRRSIMFHSPDRLHGVSGEFTYQRCHDCRTVFQDPRVIAEDLPHCYPDEYMPHQSPDELLAPIATTKTDLSMRSRLRQAVMAAVRREPAGGVIGWLGEALAKSRHLRERAFHSCVIDEMLPFKLGAGCVLEVGCGAGQMLKALTQVGWRVEGVEWDANAAEVARRTSGQQVQTGDFRQLDIPRERYDMVVLHHVLEHLPDLRSDLRKIEAILAPGGRAVLVYPNPDSLGAYVFRQNWVHWDPPRHLIMPPVRTLAKFANDSGLNLLRFRSSARYAKWALTSSRLYRSRAAVKFTFQSITFPDRLLAFCEGALIAMGFHLGEELFVVLEKPRLSKPGQSREIAGLTSRSDQPA